MDIKYLGANWQQYEVLRQSCSRIIENPVNNKYLQIRLQLLFLNKTTAKEQYINN